MPRNFAGDIDRADEFPKFYRWPQWARVSAYNPHKKRAERYRLFIFFWKNGMPPERAMHWVLYHNTYDRSAIRSMLQLVATSQNQYGAARLALTPVLVFGGGPQGQDMVL